MPTVASLREMFMPQIAPNNAGEFLRILTEADQRLLMFCRHRWTRTRITLTPASGYVTLPSTCASILGAQVESYARDIRDEQFEFTPDGPGEVRVDGTASALLIDQGLDDTGARFYKLTGNVADTDSVVALCHKAPATLYDPEVGDYAIPADAVSTTICPDPAALKNAMIGIVMEEANEPEQSSKYFAIALKTLDNKEKSFRGGSRQQLNIRPHGIGLGSIRSFR